MAFVQSLVAVRLIAKQPLNSFFNFFDCFCLLHQSRGEEEIVITTKEETVD